MNKTICSFKYLLGFMLSFTLISESYATSVKAKAASTKSSKAKLKKHIPRTREKPHSDDYMEGTASCYAPKFVGRKTTSGDRFVMDKFTGASPVLPMRTKVKVTNLKNDKVVYVEINDRMAFKSGHVIDFPKLPASFIGMNCPSGLAKVKLEIIDSSIYSSMLNAQLSGIVISSLPLLSNQEMLDIAIQLAESDYVPKEHESAALSNAKSTKESVLNINE